MLPMSELIGVLDGVDVLVSHMFCKPAPYRDPLREYIGNTVFLNSAITNNSDDKLR